MKIQIERATPSQIAQTVQEIMEKYDVDIDTVELDINFTKNGIPIMYVEDNCEGIDLVKIIDSTSKTHKINLTGKFIMKAQLESYYDEEFKRYFEQEMMEGVFQGYLYLGKKNNYYKIFMIRFELSEGELRNRLKQKEKVGYTISLVIKHRTIESFIDHLRYKFKSEDKEITKGLYPLYNLNSEDIEYIKSQADKIIDYKRISVKLLNNCKI